MRTSNGAAQGEGEREIHIFAQNTHPRQTKVRPTPWWGVAEHHLLDVHSRPSTEAHERAGGITCCPMLGRVT